MYVWSGWHFATLYDGFPATTSYMISVSLHCQLSPLSHCPSGPSITHQGLLWINLGQIFTTWWLPCVPHLSHDQTSPRRGSLPLALLAQHRPSLISDILLSKVKLNRILLNCACVLFVWSLQVSCGFLGEKEEVEAVESARLQRQAGAKLKISDFSHTE